MKKYVLALILLSFVFRVDLTLAKDKIAVLIENQFDQNELAAINDFFPVNGYQVDLVSHLWGQSELTFIGNDNKTSVRVTLEINNINPNDYKGIILIGGYAMDRLRYEANPRKNQPNMAPAVKFMREVFRQRITVGAICHGLILLTVDPYFLGGKKVTAAHNIIYDIINIGGVVEYNENGGTKDVVIFGNLVTAKHPDVVKSFLISFLNTIKNRSCYCELSGWNPHGGPYFSPSCGDVSKVFHSQI